MIDFHWLISYIILSILGWNTKIDNYLINKLCTFPRVLVVYPHTSYWDFFILINYIGMLPKEKRGCMVTLVKPSVFKYFDKILRRFGCIPSSPLEMKNGGATDYIIKHLKSKGEYIFLISPKGKRHYGEWRKGYFYIAQQLHLPVIVVGVDYLSHGIKYGTFNHPSEHTLDTHEKMEIALKKDMENIISLHPERADTYIKPHIDVLRYPCCLDYLIGYTFGFLLFGSYNIYSYIIGMILNIILIRKFIQNIK